jgi:Tfp pilus assembly protein FimT
MKNFYQKVCPQCLQHNCGRRGITVAELLVIIAAIGLLALIVLPQFSKTRELQTLKDGVQNILSSIDKARGETLSSLNSSSYGVHFQSDKVIIFKGTVFSANDANNETVSFTSPASISNIALGTGVSDIYFNRLSGAPSHSGTVTISTTSYSKIITIWATGVASSSQ